MIVPSAFPRPSPPVGATKNLASESLTTENLRRPKCPHCGSVLLIAEDSRFDAVGRIDHAWSCDDCGTAFVTTIRLRRR